MQVTQYPKQKPIRLSRNKLASLYTDVFETQNHVCQQCFTEHNIDVAPHHIIYKSRGGSDVKWNLVTLCISCHRRVHGSNNILKITHQETIPVKDMLSFLDNPVPFLIFEEVK